MKPGHRFRVPAEAAQVLRGLHPRIKQKMRAGLKLLGHDPHAGKALKEELEGLRSLRVGRFRVVYRVGPRRIIEIVVVGPQKTIYEETLKLVRKERNSQS